MKSVRKVVILLFAFLGFACEKAEQVPVSEDLLIGSWANEMNLNDEYTQFRYERVATLKNDAPGFIFRTNNVFVEKANSGWCGTPPVSYADYDGDWVQNDSIVNISVGYWGGIMQYKWKIVSLDKKYLTIEILEREAIWEYGSWNWVQSCGGQDGQTYTPETEGYSKMIIFGSDEICKFYKNGQLESQTKYKRVKGKSIYTIDESDLIEYENGFIRQSVQFIGKDTLLLNDECYDCYSNRYVRM